MLTLDDVQGIVSQDFKPAGDTPLPRTPGVYVHVARADGALFYVGSASGSEGLRKRLGQELRWVEATQADYANQHDRRVDRAAVIAGLVEHDTAAYYFETATTSEARDWERRIIHLSILLTGAPPYLRGWDVRGSSLEAFHWALRHVTGEKKLSSEDQLVEVGESD